jgi:zinc/manganese transport system permease protein
VLLGVIFATDLAARRMVFYIVFACAVTASVQLVGLYLVFTTLIVPALAGRRHRSPIIVAYLVGVLGYLLGLALSVLTDLPTGPTIVWTMATVGAAAFALGTKSAPDAV